jgi:hypothetical protein
MSNSPNTQPLFVRSHRIWTTTLSTEIASISPGSTSVPKTLIIGSDPSSAIETIQIQSTGESLETVVNFYLFDNVGTAGRSLLLCQALVPATDTYGLYRPIIVRDLPISYFPNNGNVLSNNAANSGSSGSSTTVLGMSESESTRILRLPSGWELRCALSDPIANPLIISAFGGDYY